MKRGDRMKERKENEGKKKGEGRKEERRRKKEGVQAVQVK